MHNEIQEVMGQTFGVPDDIDEDELLGELDALEDELAAEAENAQSAGGVPSYLQVRSVLTPIPATAHLVGLVMCMYLDRCLFCIRRLDNRLEHSLRLPFLCGFVRF